MAQDFAKPMRSEQPSQGGKPGWIIFTTGFVLGLFVAFLVYLWIEIPADPEAPVMKPAPSSTKTTQKKPVEEMQWDFYEIFPKSEVPVVEEFVEEGRKVKVEGPVAYLLQAGSFRNPEDADRLRAELILMGLEVFSKKIEVNGEDWHRVLVGPLSSELELNRAQDTLAQAEIESIPLRVTP